jgi:hypothetical protein
MEDGHEYPIEYNIPQTLHEDGNTVTNSLKSGTNPAFCSTNLCFYSKKD